MTDPVAIFITLAALCGAIYWLSSRPALAPVFRFIPPVLLVVFIPAAASALGAIPRSSSTYGVMRDILLPCGLFLMIVTTDVRGILRVGPRSLLLMLCGSVGVVAGGIAAFAACRSALPAQSWKVMAAITGSWIGGGASFAAVQSAVSMPNSLVGPAIVVDATVSYSWLAFVLFIQPYRDMVERFYTPKATLLDVDETPIGASTAPRETSAADLLMVLGLGLPMAALAMRGGHATFQAAVSHFGPDHSIFLVLSDHAMGFLFVTLLGIALSFSSVRRIDTMGAPAVSYAAQFLYFASLGAQADFAAALSTPLLLVAGLIMISVHILSIVVGARLMRAPLSLAAVCSIASLGGSSAAAIVGAQYGRSWASLGVLLGLFGHLIGTLAGLLSAIVLVRLASS